MSGPKVVGPHSRSEVLAALADDHVIAVPLPGGYQLVARLDRPIAIGAMRDLAPTDGGTVPHFLVGQRDQAMALASEWTEVVRRLTDRVWPGPVTVTVMAMAGDGAVRISMPAWRPLRMICRESGPLLLAGLRQAENAPITSVDNVASRLAGSRVALIVDGGTCAVAGPTVVDCRHSPPAVSEVGALPELFIEAALLMGTGRRKWFSNSGVLSPRNRTGTEGPP